MSITTVTTLTCNGCGLASQHIDDTTTQGVEQSGRFYGRLPWHALSFGPRTRDSWDMCPDCWSLIKKQMREHTFRERVRNTG